MACHQADATQQAAWRSSGKRPSCTKRHLLGLAIRGTLARSTRGVRSLHHLLQPLCSLAAGWCLEPHHRRTCRCPRWRCPDDRHLYRPRASATRSNGSSTGSSNAAGPRHATTNSPPTTLPSSSLHRSGFGWPRALMSSRPSAQDQTHDSPLAGSTPRPALAYIGSE